MARRGGMSAFKLLRVNIKCVTLQTARWGGRRSCEISVKVARRGKVDLPVLRLLVIIDGLSRRCTSERWASGSSSLPPLSSKTSRNCPRGTGPRICAAMSPLLSGSKRGRDRGSLVLLIEKLAHFRGVVGAISVDDGREMNSLEESHNKHSNEIHPSHETASDTIISTATSFRKPTFLPTMTTVTFSH